MAVPTIYAKLIEFFHKNVDEKAGTFLGKSFEEIRKICDKEIRLMVSGSATLPQVFDSSNHTSQLYFRIEVILVKHGRILICCPRFGARANTKQILVFGYISKYE